MLGKFTNWLKTCLGQKSPIYTIRYRWKPSTELPAFLWDGKESSRKAFNAFVGDDYIHIAGLGGSFTYIHPNQLTFPKGTFIWKEGGAYMSAGSHHINRNFIVTQE